MLLLQGDKVLDATAAGSSNRVLNLQEFVSPLRELLFRYRRNSCLHLRLTVKNEGAHSMRLCVEPLSDQYEILSGQRVDVCVQVKQNTQHLTFSITKTDGEIIVFSPGGLSDFIDSFVVAGGVRLVPL